MEYSVVGTKPSAAGKCLSVGEIGLSDGDFSVALGVNQAHNGLGNINNGAGMPFYDTAGLVYDSGVRYDDASSPTPSGNHMAKVKLDLKNLKPDETIALANTIKTAMTGNANFTAPNPTLTALGTLITTAETKLSAAHAARVALDLAMDERDAATAALRAGLTQEAAYVENITGGDRAKIESAGMGVRGDGARLGGPTQVLNLVVAEGDREGALAVDWERLRGVKSYEVQTSADPITATSWSFKMSASKSSATLKGLTSGSRVWVRVRAIGAENATGPWSDPAVKTVP
jgi:hypothetical protein